MSPKDSRNLLVSHCKVKLVLEQLKRRGIADAC